jgi:hypothetical protein
MSTFYELSAVAKDAFVVLNGVVEIRYRDGDIWRPEGAQSEHPVVHRLRAASLASLTQEPEEPPTQTDAEMSNLLKNERQANENMRAFLIELEDICHAAGMPKTVVGNEVLLWVKEKLGTK